MKNRPHAESEPSHSVQSSFVPPVLKDEDEPDIDASGSVREAMAHVVQTGLAFQPARTLLGWLTDDMAQRLFSPGQLAAELNRTQLSTLRKAREGVSSRAGLPDQSGAVFSIPLELRDYISQLRASASAQNYFAEGWDVRLVDLTRIVAFQPTVSLAGIDEHGSGITTDDVEEIAKVTLPVAPPSPLRSSFDEQRHVWTFTSPNPNLRVVGHFAGQVGGQPLPVFGFFVGLQPSFMQVAEFGGRLILRDGYHRAVGLLRNGVTVAPAFVRQFQTLEQLVPAGMFPQHVFLGQNPPLLGDYLDDSVAVTMDIPVASKLVVVQALEVNFAT